jgi:hypothetical protein
MVRLCDPCARVRPFAPCVSRVCPGSPGVFEPVPVRMCPGSHGIFLPVLNRSGSPLSFYR